MAAFPNSLWILCPKVSRVAIVNVPDLHIRWIQRGNHSRIDAANRRRGILQYRVMRQTTAFPAPMEPQIVIEPAIVIRLIHALHQTDLSGVVICPQGSVAPAKRTVAVENPRRSRLNLEPDRCAVACSFDHVVVSSGRAVRCSVI